MIVVDIRTDGYVLADPSRFFNREKRIAITLTHVMHEYIEFMLKDFIAFYKHDGNANCSGKNEKYEKDLMV